MALKIWDGDSIETPKQLHIKVTDGTVKFVNYAVVKETDGSLSTFSRSTENPTPVPHINIYIHSSKALGLSTGI